MSYREREWYVNGGAKDFIAYQQRWLNEAKADIARLETELREVKAERDALRERGLDLDKLQREIIRLQVVAALEGNPDGARALTPQEDKGS